MIPLTEPVALYQGRLNGARYSIEHTRTGVRELFWLTIRRDGASITDSGARSMAEAYSRALAMSLRTDETGALNLYGILRTPLLWPEQGVNA